MTKQIFRQWDWEFDFGIEALPLGAELPKSHVVAYFDFWGRLYRVHRFENSLLADVYDYYCDESGKIVEKRSVFQGVDGHVCIIVRYTYDLRQQTVTETAWWPDSSDPPKSVVRKKKCADPKK